MGVDNLCLSLSLHRFLALWILLADDHKRGSDDVTFFFGAVFGIAASAAVACNPSVRCGQKEECLKRRETSVPLARSLSRSVSLGTFRECHKSTNSVATVSQCNSRQMYSFHLSRPQLDLDHHP